ncbi:hypothetical protein [Microbacterium oxydans]|uniref:Uncharacterized protein n=1 Tax=Microbacterium oxydans TaxID=82380 RepID=A0A0F0LFB7_9MICO|nr:hypothetical protein [Microbacterium oxydans]KJL30216.1 hypothetical protein RS83_00966 [Microbacterium oxydans]
MRSNERGRFFGTAALAVVLAVGLVGCASLDGEDSESVKNQATWTMPLDEFYVYSPELDNYAEQLLIANCLEAQGYQWPVPWQDTNYEQAEDFNAIGFRLFTVELAKKWGYHFAPPANPTSTQLWGEFVDVTDSYFPDAELDEAFLSCTDEVREEDEDFLTSVDGVNYLAGLALQAEQVVQQDDAVIEATDKWRTCLEPKVDFTLPQDPRTEMPPADAQRKWGLDDESASAEELAVAVADAECRDSSGLSEITYEKSWAEQEKLVEENRDNLERIRSEAAERKEYLLTIVAANAPAAP